MLRRTHVFVALVELLRDLYQYFDEIGDGAAGRADVGHEEHGVARGLVDLDAVLLHQEVVLERVAVDAGGADVEREPGRIDHELVGMPAFLHARPALIRVEIGLDAGGPIFARNEIARGQEVKVFLQQRMGRDTLAQGHRVIDLLLHQLVALELHLAPADVERSEDLVVGRGRGVGHVRLVKRVLHLVLEVLVVHVNHRALAQRGEGLVRGLGHVDAHPRPVRIGHETGGQPLLVLDRRAEPLLEFRVAPAIVGVAEALAQARGGAHAGAPAVGRVKRGEGEPGFVPEENHIRLDGEALFHHPLDVVHDAVESTVGEQHQLHPLELAGALQREQRTLDRFERHRAVHRVFVQRIGIEIDDVRARQHHAVVMRLVTVAVQQHDVARLDQGLHHDLVRGRGAVGDEESSLRAERAGGELLRALDRPDRLQQRVEPARGSRGLGEKNTQAVEVDHVLDPVRLQHRLTARNRQRVKHPRGLLAVMAQRGEERRLVAVGDALQEAEMQLAIVLLAVEHAMEVFAQLARDFFRGHVGHEIEIELGP